MEQPSGGEDVIDGTAFGYRGDESDGIVEFPATREAAIRFATLRKTDYPWDLAIQTKTTLPIEKGDTLLFTARLRAISTASETGDAQVEVVFEESAAPHGKSMIARTGLRPEDGWKTIYFPFEAQQRYTAGEGQLSLRPGFGPQLLEIADVRVINYRRALRKDALPITHSSYAGREPDAAWRVEALKRIEKIRKADLRVRVLDAEANPVNGATVHVAMRRHAYVFGSAVSASFLMSDSPDVANYRTHIEQMFNRVVIENDLKWPAWSEDPNVAMSALRWFRERGIAVRGHNLVWPSWKYTPKVLRSKANDAVALRTTIDEHVTQEATATRGLVVEWDVVNEPFSERDILDVLGDNVMADWFRLARHADPEAKLFINDFPSLAGGKHLDQYEKTISRLLELKAPLDGIGLQCHYGADLVPPERVLAALDRFSRFGLPIQATEFDIENYDEQLQADYLRDHMIAFFSHPATSGVVMWGFWEGRHWKPTAALYRKDWSLRPNGLVWLDLVFKQWWTDEHVNTNSNGTCAVRGFQGDYVITVVVGDRSLTRTISLPREGLDVMLTLP